mmetsp:Transcript_152076/g.488291  ORF Transcript_152076/g.488291 Transcript_152076/m.488291 type:complete len:290 (+) Transcript_152076:1442-2311(+)
MRIRRMLTCGANSSPPLLALGDDDSSPPAMPRGDDDDPWRGDGEDRGEGRVGDGGGPTFSSLARSSRSADSASRFVLSCFNSAILLSTEDTRSGIFSVTSSSRSRRIEATSLVSLKSSARCSRLGGRGAARRSMPRSSCKASSSSPGFVDPLLNSGANSTMAAGAWLNVTPPTSPRMRRPMLASSLPVLARRVVGTSGDWAVPPNGGPAGGAKAAGGGSAAEESAAPPTMSRSKRPASVSAVGKGAADAATAVLAEGSTASRSAAPASAEVLSKGAAGGPGIAPKADSS